MGKIIGIDLGTTNSVVAVMEGGEPKVIPSAEGSPLVPSVVAINPKTNERLVGQLARRQAVVNPENTIFSIKRFMGRKFADPEVQRAIKTVPYKVTAAANGDIRVHMGGKEYSRAGSLGHDPREAEDRRRGLPGRIDHPGGHHRAGVFQRLPAPGHQGCRPDRRAWKSCGSSTNRRPVPWPTGWTRKRTKPSRSTTWAAAPSTSRSSTWATACSKCDPPTAIPSWAATTSTSASSTGSPTSSCGPTGIDLRKDRQALQRLKEASEKAKIELSTVMQSEINLPFITADASGPKHLTMTLTRAKLEQLTGDLIDRSIQPVNRALDDAHLKVADIDEVVLVGGMTRMPAVQEAVKKAFAREPNRSVNPDEVVAVGAAIQAGVLGGDVKDILLLDVTPLTLSVETLGGVATPLIERNTTIPARKSQIFSTASDSQTSVEIHVVQGERPLAADNKSLDRMLLDGIPPAPRGVPQIEVIFDIDSDGILNVTAQDKATGRSQHITIQRTSGLSKDEVEKMTREAEAHRDEDSKRKEQIEVRNTADSAVYTAEKALRDAGDKVPANVKDDVNAKISAVRSALQGQDARAIQKATTDLAQAAQAIGSAMYGKGEPQPPQQGGPGGPGGPSGPGSSGGDVVDGEFKPM